MIEKLDVELTHYGDGQLRCKFQNLNGEKHGEQLGYHKDGKLWFRCQYLNGEMVSNCGMTQTF